MIDATRLGFDPFLGWPVLSIMLAIAAAAWVAYVILRGRAALSRGLALTMLAAALSNPSLVQEEREPLPSVAALVLDKSESMQFGDRARAANAAFAQIKAELEANASLELRIVESDPGADGTHLIAALQGVMADVPRDRIAGAILVSDGQIHDLPGSFDAETDIGPVHGVIVGDPTRGDRRVEIVDAPSFGIVGETAGLIIRVDDDTVPDVEITVSQNGAPPERVRIRTGQDTPLPIQIERRGSNVVVVEAPPGREELTLANNRTAATLSGVRDRLRVLLVTGKPNQSGRVWRDLLKSDPSVDLVHFTILRPPTKFDAAPTEELALIAFPTDELFEDKLGEFDLIIFDQYERRGVVTQLYLANMARYVTDGGALLIAAGEPFAGVGSLARSPLAAVLPATPTGVIRTGRFTPKLTEAGKRHTVTAPLDGREWGDWFRYIEADAQAGDVLMSGPGGEPLLIVDRVGKGRVGQLMSDQIWLWARGHEQGGPFAETIRRVVHWMMKEPELEERRLTLVAEGDTAQVELRTLLDTAPPLQIETPEGLILEPEWTRVEDGVFKAETQIDQLGLYRAQAGGLESVTLNGPANPKEYADLQSTTEVMAPYSKASGGGVFRINDAASNVPDIRNVTARASATGSNWMGLRERGAYAVRSSTSQPLLPGIFAAALLILLMMLAWRREGR